MPQDIPATKLPSTIMGEILYSHALETGRSIAPHLPYLRGLVSDLQPKRIAEFGTGMAHSTLAMRLGTDPHLTHMNSFDLVRKESPARTWLEQGKYLIFNSSGISDVRELAKIVVGNKNGPDFLFIDDDHTYEHVLWELNTFAPEVEKWIVMHDTQSPRWPGVRKAMMEFLGGSGEGKGWKILHDIRIGHGLTALVRQ